MQFIQISANKYIGSNGYTLRRRVDGSFCICKGDKVTKWGQGFQTVKSAELFMNDHPYIDPYIDDPEISEADLECIYDTYVSEVDGRGRWRLDSKHLLKPIIKKDSIEVIVNNADGSSQNFYTIESLLYYLDSLTNSDVFASVIYRGIEFRNVLAASKRRSSKRITEDLVRVKSSNVWAYGVEVNNNDMKIGDVYIQFKGKNGGPGDIYKYYDVPINLWRKVLSSPSKGHAVWKYLRNNFLYSKLTGDKRGKLANAVN